MKLPHAVVVRHAAAMLALWWSSCSACMAGVECDGVVDVAMSGQCGDCLERCAVLVTVSGYEAGRNESQSTANRYSTSSVGAAAWCNSAAHCESRVLASNCTGERCEWRVMTSRAVCCCSVG